MNKMEAPLHLEILIATVDRTSLDFLNVMFQNNKWSDYQILIINQTSKACILVSDDPKIRVINSYEKGLSKSRNLAIENAIEDICLFADDDVIYVENFEKNILESYANIANADFISFKTLTTTDRAYSNYPNEQSTLNGFIKYVLSIEMTFRRSSIQNSKIRFNEQFGLGATFEDSENYLFLKDLIEKKLKLFFVPEYIVIHEPLSSSDAIGSDRFIFARSALNYKLYGNLAYIYIAKLVFYLLRHRLIRTTDINQKLKVAHSGIQTFKKLNQS